MFKSEKGQEEEGGGGWGQGASGLYFRLSGKNYNLSRPSFANAFFVTQYMQ